VLRSLKNLHQLNLSCNSFSDTGFALLLLPETYSPSLKTLDLSFNSLTEVTAYRLATQMFEPGRRCHLEAIILGGKGDNYMNQVPSYLRSIMIYFSERSQFGGYFRSGVAPRPHAGNIPHWSAATESLAPAFC